MDCNGDIIKEWTKLQVSSSLIQLEGRCLLIALGEAADFGIVRQKYQGPGVAGFRREVQVGMAHVNICDTLLHVPVCC